MHPDWFRDIYARYFYPTCRAYFCNQTEADIFRYQMYWITLHYDKVNEYPEELLTNLRLQGEWGHCPKIQLFCGPISGLDTAPQRCNNWVKMGQNGAHFMTWSVLQHSPSLKQTFCAKGQLLRHLLGQRCLKSTFTHTCPKKNCECRLANHSVLFGFRGGNALQLNCLLSAEKQSMRMRLSFGQGLDTPSLFCLF